MRSENVVTGQFHGIAIFVWSPHKIGHLSLIASGFVVIFLVSAHEWVNDSIFATLRSQAHLLSAGLRHRLQSVLSLAVFFVSPPVAEEIGWVVGRNTRS